MLEMTIINVIFLTNVEKCVIFGLSQLLPTLTTGRIAPSRRHPPDTGEGWSPMMPFVVEWRRRLLFVLCRREAVVNRRHRQRRP